MSRVRQRVRRMFVAVVHVPHCPSQLGFFETEAAALRYEDPNGGHIETVTPAGGETRPLGTWLDCDPDSAQGNELMGPRGARS